MENNKYYQLMTESEKDWCDERFCILLSENDWTDQRAAIEAVRLTRIHFGIEFRSR
jgi:hypothetical protein